MERRQQPEKPKGQSGSSVSQRPCKEHSFLTDVNDVRIMEQGLLQLLEDFHSGKLQAFGGTDMYDQMNEIRANQEQLAQLHFDLDLQQDMRRMASEEARARNYENISKMIGKLHGLSTAVQQLQRSQRSPSQKDKT